MLRRLSGLTYGGTPDDQAFGYFFPGHRFPADTNSNLECLRRILLRVKAERGGTLPKTLYIQLDNTPKDNKNWTLLGYSAYLLFEG